MDKALAELVLFVTLIWLFSILIRKARATARLNKIMREAQDKSPRDWFDAPPKSKV